MKKLCLSKSVRGCGRFFNKDNVVEQGWLCAIVCIFESVYVFRSACISVCLTLRAIICINKGVHVTIVCKSVCICACVHKRM